MSAEDLSEILRTIPLGVVVLDTDAERILFKSAQADDLLRSAGVPDEYRAVAEFFAAPETTDQAVRRRVGQRTVGFSTYDSGGARWVFCRDISERARVEAVGEAIEQTKGLGSVFSLLRHEMGNPLNSAKISLNVLKLSLPNASSEQVLTYVNRSLAELSRVEDLLRALRGFAFHDAVNPGPVDLNALVRDFSAALRPDLESQGIALTLDLDPAAGTVAADAEALWHVLQNLVSNSEHALAERSERLLTLRTAALRTLTSIRVEDNGAGIPERVKRQLFTPTYSGRPSGISLGLVVSRNLLAKMDGTIDIESAEGAGTTVLITLRRLHP